MFKSTTGILAVVAVAVAVLAASPLGQAAANMVVPRNSVGTLQLKTAAVTGAKVKNGTLTAADFKAGQLPAGPKGDKGDPGAQGPKGDKGDPGSAVLNVTVRSNSMSLAAGKTDGLFTFCNPGERATGGGIVSSVTAGVDVTTTMPYPISGTPTQWYGEGHNTTASAVTLTVYVVCAAG
jgi:hypothetical protein